MKHEQYADKLLQIAEIQQKLQSYYLLPLAMMHELQEAGKETLNRVDQLRTMAAQPSEIKGLRRDLRQLQKEIKDYERSQNVTGKIRIIREKLSLSEKLQKELTRYEKLQKQREQIPSKGMQGLLTSLFRRKQVEQLHNQLINSEREIHRLRLAAPRPRQVKALKKSLSKHFTEKSERDIKRDIREMKKEINIFRQADLERALIRFYQEKASVKGLDRLKLIFKHAIERLSGRALEQRLQKADDIQANHNIKGELREFSFWRTILHPEGVYLKQAEYLQKRLSLYEKQVPSERVAYRLGEEIADWQKELIKKQQLQREREWSTLRETSDRAKTERESVKITKSWVQSNAADRTQQTQKVDSIKERLLRLDPDDITKLREAKIEFRMVEEKDKGYAVLEQKGLIEDREYKGIQVAFAREQIPTIEKVLGRSLQIDPEAGTVKYADFVKEPGKNLLIPFVTQGQIEELKRSNIRFAAFRKNENVYNVYVKTAAVHHVQKVVQLNPLSSKRRQQAEETNKSGSLAHDHQFNRRLTHKQVLDR
ncbi:hypothetical protein LOK74_02030 [Brevibacillus humidisoli]|uniref:hypothetical protein n=1 Tax=Brevibacillus humidisoli TaxID=2895522 RepID=UPI001E5F55E9|nr:hypothetical protein [Brevibacillus humidisoli]UFJ41339.1 hypothetical protein LOK74_02030 [Brevibacillus humidisoli]